MQGPQLTGDLITGLKAGVFDSVQSIQTTLSNNVIGEIAVFLIGFSIGVALLMFFIMSHRKIGGGKKYASDAFPGMSRKQRTEWNRLDDYGMPR